MSRIFIIIVAAYIAGCSVLQHDMTNDPIVRNIANQCYSVQKDSLLYEIGCATLENNVFASRCLTIQALDEFCLPENRNQFDSNPKYWEKKMYRCGKAGRKVGKGIVSAGTQLKIEKILNAPGPELNHYWNIKARLTTGTFAGEEVFLPVYPSGQIIGPKWFHPFRIHPSEESSVPEPDQVFLAECD